MINTLAIGLWLGLLFNAAPGAVFSESLRRGVRGGFAPALAVQVGSLVGDAVWAVLGLAGVAALMTLDGIRVPLTLLGAIALAWLGYQGLRDAIRPRPAEQQDGPTSGAALRIGMVLSLGNPMNIVYWAGAATTVSAVIGEHPTRPLFAMFLAGFMMSSLIWCIICAALIAILRRALAPMATRLLEGLCGASLIVFSAIAASTLW
ncbi:MAG: LysE family transporter [Pseudonocardiaceae bacterium]